MAYPGLRQKGSIIPREGGQVKETEKDGLTKNVQHELQRRTANAAGSNGSNSSLSHKCHRLHRIEV